MINSLCGSTGSLKSESCCSKLLPTSSNASLVLESKNTSLTSGFEQNGLTPSSLNFPCLKFEEMEVQSPENSLWESFFSDQLDGGDFMISSPVRNTLPSAQGTNFNYNNYNYVHQSMHAQSLLGWSPPRASSPLGPYSSTNNKGKGLSPLHRVFNTSPNNNQFMQVESLSLPALENFLDDYEKENEFLSYSTMNKSSSSECYEALTTVPALLDCLTMSKSSRFCGPDTSAHGGSSQLSQESDVYQMRSMGTAPLLQQLQEERQQEKQKQQHPPLQRAQQLQQAQNIDHTLVIPLSIAPEQVKPLSVFCFF